MKYELSFGNSVINLPSSVAGKLPEAGENELKFLLYFSINPELCSDFEKNAKEISKQLSISENELEAALSFWRGAGVIVTSKKRPEKISVPKSIDTYTGEEIKEIVETNGLESILYECQRITGKLYNQTEVSKIAALNSYLNLDAEYILLLFQYCNDKGNSSLRYIEKTAYALFDEGIDTFDKLELYIRSLDEKKSLEGKLRRMFGWGDRKLTPSENKHIATWINDYHYDLGVIEEAYNITVEKTGKLSLPYLSKILSNWYEHGYKTIEEIHSAMDAYEAGKLNVNNKNNDNFDVDEFFELALKRSKKKLKN